MGGSTKNFLGEAPPTQRNLCGPTFNEKVLQARTQGNITKKLNIPVFVGPNGPPTNLKLHTHRKQRYNGKNPH